MLSDPLDVTGCGDCGGRASLLQDIAFANSTAFAGASSSGGSTDL
jgi:hypothetical protein